MLADVALNPQSKRALALCILAILLIILCIGSSRPLAGILVNSDQRIGIHQNTSPSVLDDRWVGDRTALAAGPGLMLQPSKVEGRGRWTARRIIKEVGKQAIDQPGHFLIGGAPIWASRYLVGVPWLGWVAAPILAYREWLQWPSNRWWDPPLDWAFLTLGAVAATRSRRPGHRLSGGLAGIRQSVASALRGNAHPAR